MHPNTSTRSHTEVTARQRRPLRFGILLFGIYLGFGISGFGISTRAPAQTPANRNDDIVEMQTLEVFSAPAYTWHYARADDFEILSALDNDKLAASIIRQALQIINLFKAHSPLFSNNHELPVKIILIKDHNVSRFITAIDEREGARIAENSRTSRNAINRPELQGVETGVYSPNQHISVLKKTNDEQAQILMYVPAAYDGASDNYVAVSALVSAYFELCLRSRNIKLSNLTYAFTSAKILSIDSSERATASGRAGAELIDPETVWFAPFRSGILIRRFDYGRERDIFRGIASDYDALRPSDKKEVLSKFMAAPSLALRDVLEHPDMFRISYKKKNTMREVENYLTYKRQVSDFAIYCVFSPDEQIRAGYEALLNATKKEPLSEDLFIKCLGKNYADFSENMSAFYREMGDDNHPGKANAWGAPQFTISLQGSKPQPRPVFRNAIRGERPRILGEWFLACHAPELAGKIYARAQGTDSMANTMADTDPEFLASLGLYEAGAGDKTKALPLLEKAVALGTTRPAVNRELARLRSEEKNPNGNYASNAKAFVSRLRSEEKNPNGNPNGVLSSSPRLPESARATLGFDKQTSPTPTGLCPPAPESFPLGVPSALSFIPDLTAAKQPADDKWAFSLLPVGLQRNPTVDYAIIGKLTAAGRALPPPSFDHPVYYMSHSMGQRNYVSPLKEGSNYTSFSMGKHWLGNAYGIMKDVRYDGLRQQLLHSLAANGYSPADAMHPPSQLLVFSWGLRGLDGDFEEDEPRNFIRVYYYMLVTSLDIEALHRNKMKILWATKIATIALGINFRQTLPIMISNASYFFGRETHGTHILTKRAYKRADVNLGEMTVVDYLTGTATPAPAAPAKSESTDK